MSCGRACAIAFALLLPFAPPAPAQDYPSRHITVVVPAPPGGSIDIFARQLGDLVQPVLKQRFVVDNKPGAGGSIGVRNVVAAAPDGYTLGFVWDGPLTTLPHSMQVGYTPESYVPVMSFGYSAYTICARSDFPAQDAKELFARLAQSPDHHTLGLDSLGGTMHLAAVRIFAKAGIRVRFVPYGGAADVLKGFLTRDVDLYGSSIAPILAHVTSGRARCLLVTSAAGNPALPQAAGLESLGLAGEETVLWWGVIAPGKTPPAVLQLLESTLTRAATSDRFRELLSRQGGTLQILGGAEMAQRIRRDLAALGQAARDAGVQQR